MLTVKKFTGQTKA